MYGFSDWWEFEDERVIEEQFREHWRDPYARRRLIDKTRTYRRDDSFVEDFNFYYHYLENKRRKFEISATFLCFDCEKYYCTNCVGKHSGHFMFSKDDKYDISKWGTISVEMLNRLKAADQKRENMKREQTYLCDVVSVRYRLDELGLRYVLRRLEENETFDNVWWLPDVRIYHIVIDLHILSDNKRWLVADDENNCINIFNVNDNKMTRHIKLSSPPWGITEIPSADPSQSLIAVSFPQEQQITIMNIHSTPAQVVSSISVDCECRDLAYCNNKFIILCDCFLDRERRYSIHVMDMAGEIINVIDLHNLPGIKLKWYYSGCMSVHAESETIYVCHQYYPSSVISLSLDGQVKGSNVHKFLRKKKIGSGQRWRLNDRILVDFGDKN